MREVEIHYDESNMVYRAAWVDRYGHRLWLRNAEGRLDAVLTQRELELLGGRSRAPDLLAKFTHVDEVFQELA